MEGWKWRRFIPDEEEEERGLGYSKSDASRFTKIFSLTYVPLISIYSRTNENCRQRYSKSSIVTSEQIQSLIETISKMIMFILVIFIIY